MHAAIVTFGIVPVDLVETVEARVAIDTGERVDVVAGSLVVSFKVAFHSSIDAEVVLLEVKARAVVVIVAAAVRCIIGHNKIIVQ